MTFSKVTTWAAITTVDFRTCSPQIEPHALSTVTFPVPQLPPHQPLAAHDLLLVAVDFPIGGWLLGYFYFPSE